MMATPSVMALTLVAAFVASAALTGLIRRYASKRLLDLPNQRSSHVKPTPRGGGLSIVITFSVAVVTLWILKLLPTPECMAILGGSILVAGMGLWDDYVSLPIAARLAGQFTAALWTVTWLSPMRGLKFGSFKLDWRLFGYCAACAGIVWLVNLYNFMDGIDGLAASEAVFVAVVSGFVLKQYARPGLALVSWFLAACATGFLVWNWPPAKIFLGDVGSGFLGFVFATMMLASLNSGFDAAWVWIILLGVFIVDATITLCTRAVRGAPWYEPHKSHAYQNAATRWGHFPVILSVVILNVIWLTPLALVALSRPKISFAVTVLALLPLVVLVAWLKAGREGKATLDF